MAPKVQSHPPRILTLLVVLLFSLFSTMGFAQSTKENEKKELTVESKARLLQDLEKQVEERRSEIAREEERLVSLTSAMQAVKRELREELERLEALKVVVDEQIERRTTIVNERLDSIAKVYKAMKAKEASITIADMDDDMAVSILERLPGKTVGKIFNTMPKERVRQLTRRMEEGRIQRE
jgi:flagellar motility protein MotE (MotC chaperone)